MPDDLQSLWESAKPIPAQQQDADLAALWDKAQPPRAATQSKSLVPSDLSVALNASSKGIAALPDMFLNAPANMMNLGRAAVGTVTNLLGRPDLSPGIVPPPSYAHRLLTKAGAIRPENEPQSARQRIIDAAVQGATGMALNPASSGVGMAKNAALGATGGLASGATLEATGSPAASIVAGMAAPAAAQAAGNYGRARVAEALAQRAAAGESVNDATLTAARRAGYVIPPSEVNRHSAIDNALESFGGKAALKQEAALRNQEVTNRLAVRELGLPEGTAITDAVLRDFRQRISAPYREVQALSPVAANTLEQLQNAREQMQAAWREYSGPNHPRQALADARALTAQVQNLETQLERIATTAGRTELVPQLRDARTQIAKSHDIERAMNVGDADISARAIGRNLDRNSERMTGNLRTIGAFAEGPGAKFTQEGSRVPSPNVSATNLMGSALLGSIGHQALGLPGLTAAAIPFARTGARSLILSEPYQNLMASPTAGAGIINRSLAGIDRSTPQGRILEALLIARSQADAQGNRNAP